MRLTRFSRVCSVVGKGLRPLTACLVIFLALGLPAVAYSDPPDPAWIPGFWDDDDFDNVAEALTSTLVWDDATPTIVAYIESCPSPLLLPSEFQKPVLRPLVWPESRAPPDV